MKNVFSISPCPYNFWYTCTSQSRNYREVCKAVLPWPRAVLGASRARQPLHRLWLRRRKGEAGAEGDGEGRGQVRGTQSEPAGSLRSLRVSPLAFSWELKKVHPELRGWKSTCY